ncbi:MAG: RelA/SpoT domain-containing protein [Candidatus Nanopelagicales bacterium]
MVLTNSQLDKAGRMLRRHQRGESITTEQYNKALLTIFQYRSEHQEPLNTAQMGLRSAVRTEGLDPTGKVSSRLKQERTIVDKLRREATLSLSRMADIGGCRAILPTVAAVQDVRRRLEKDTSARHHEYTRDYIKTPRGSGYRGMHVILRYKGRLVEMQLRTPVMHAWALAVESLSMRHGEDYKGELHEPVTGWLSSISAAMALEEVGQEVPEELLREIARQRMLVDNHWRGSAI